MIVGRNRLTVEKQDSLLQLLDLPPLVIESPQDIKKDIESIKMEIERRYLNENDDIT